MTTIKNPRSRSNSRTDVREVENYQVEYETCGVQDTNCAYFLYVLISIQIMIMFIWVFAKNTGCDGEELAFITDIRCNVYFLLTYKETTIVFNCNFILIMLVMILIITKDQFQEVLEDNQVEYETCGVQDTNCAYSLYVLAGIQIVMMILFVFTMNLYQQIIKIYEGNFILMMVLMILLLTKDQFQEVGEAPLNPPSRSTSRSQSQMVPTGKDIQVEYETCGVPDTYCAYFLYVLSGIQIIFVFLWAFARAPEGCLDEDAILDIIRCNVGDLYTHDVTVKVYTGIYILMMFLMTLLITKDQFQEVGEDDQVEKCCEKICCGICD